MMGIVRTIVSARGEQEYVLFRNIGRDSWNYNGRMRRGHLNVAGAVLHVWLFEFELIADDDVKLHMVRQRVNQNGVTALEALDYLLHSTQALPVEEVSLREVWD